MDVIWLLSLENHPPSVCCKHKYHNNNTKLDYNRGDHKQVSVTGKKEISSVSQRKSLCLATDYLAWLRGNLLKNLWAQIHMLCGNDLVV